MTKTEWRVEGLAGGKWHQVDRPADYLPDPRAHRDEVVNMLRENKITRYRKVRLVKYVTTIEVVGGEISV